MALGKQKHGQVQEKCSVFFIKDLLFWVQNWAVVFCVPGKLAQG